jgi:hypothetical protein
LRAIDDENKRSNVIRAPYTSGPENLPPSVVFLTKPSEPVTGPALWSWQGTDTDSDILRYQWAFDLTSDADWQLLGEDHWLDPATTSFNRTFTRAEGSTQTPQSYTFHLRAQDSDSTYSAPLTTRSRSLCRRAAARSVPGAALSHNPGRLPADDSVVRHRRRSDRRL